MPSPSATQLFEPLKRWFFQAQRDLPWRHDRSAYRVWLSEIMLQQTQVATVLAYFNRFIEAFPNVEALAEAPEEKVLALWSGLGYYSRGRNLHKAAQILVAEHWAQFPERYEDLLKLPGIGTYTAGAICAFAYDQAAPVVDGNIARVLARVFDDETLGSTPAGKRHFEALSLKLASQAPSPRVWQEALMELGATLCKPKSPECERCPLATSCLGFRRGRAESLPTKKGKAARQPLRVVCALVHTTSHIWLEKTDQGRLFKGLFAPPSQTLDPTLEATPTIKQLLAERQINLPAALGKPVVLQRTLTHRDLTLEGFNIMLPEPSPATGHWVSKSELPRIGMSTAMRKLLALVFSLLVPICFTSACSHTKHSRSQTLAFAKSLVGKRSATYKGKHYRPDCSGTVRAIYDHAGLWLGSSSSKEPESDSATIYRYIQKAGTISERDPAPGDVVFFDNTYDRNRDGLLNDSLTHVGVVEEVLPDQTVLFIHHLGNSIVRSSMNLERPERGNDMLRRATKESKGLSAAELFVGFGKLDAFRL